MNRSGVGHIQRLAERRLRNTLIVLGVVTLALYVASYFHYRANYTVERDSLRVTLYEEDSIPAILASMIHGPLLWIDQQATGRVVEVGNWRVPSSDSRDALLRTD